MPPKKKEPFNPFPTHSKVRSTAPPAPVVPEDVKPGEFRDTSIVFTPALARAETCITLQFRCTTKIARGDTITIRLPGFKGPASVFALEFRKNPEVPDVPSGTPINNRFQGYWSGEEQPKGGAPPQAIILQCREEVPENTLVVVAVPEALQIQLPEKLAANSPKLKIEGVVRHAEGGKIPKAQISQSTEVRKRPVEEEIEELQALLRETQAVGDLREEDVQFAQEVTQQEADQIWEASRERCDLKLGLIWRIETQTHHTFDNLVELASIVNNIGLEQNKRSFSVSLALHKELAANLGVKVGAIIVLEDALYSVHGTYYPELTRSAILVLRLFTMEANDIMRTFGLTPNSSAGSGGGIVCIYREINSAFRSVNRELLAKWSSFIAALSTATSKVLDDKRLAEDPDLPSRVPVLYRGVKDLPPERVQALLALKKDTLCVFPAPTTVTAESKHAEEGFTCPDGAVLFEIHDVTEAIELGDVSQVPEDEEWLLPMFSSFDVVSVDVLADKNHLTRVVLRMKSTLASRYPSDDRFPENQRTAANATLREAKRLALLSSARTQNISKFIYANLKLLERKAQHPLYLMHSQYLAQFAETRRASVARQTVEDGTVKWQQCTAEATVTPDNTVKPATWDKVSNKQAFLIELNFLKRTRANKIFTGDGLVSLNFLDFTVDLGKGVRKIRRLVGKVVTHQPPVPKENAAAAAPPA